MRYNVLAEAIARVIAHWKVQGMLAKSAMKQLRVEQPVVSIDDERGWIDPVPHQYETHAGCQEVHCLICDGGLAICTVCGQAEGDLEPNCPGPRPVTHPIA